MSILNHTCVGTNNKAASEKFYTASLGELGIKCMGEMGNGATMYGDKAPEFLVFTPRDGNTASVGNGTTTGFRAATRAQVDAFHAAGMANGGTCDGPAGPRTNVAPTAYGAYLKDPDGNKVCAFCFADE